MTMKTIAVLLDFSDLTSSLLEKARTLAQAFQSHVIFLHGVAIRRPVSAMGTVSATTYVEPTKKQIEVDHAKLVEVTGELATSGIKVSLLELRETTVDHIVEEAERLKADLIIVGFHHHSAFYTSVVGSVANDVLKRTTCPVLVVPEN